METVVRATIIFFFLWGITRVVGRSTLGELSSFELILFIIMGDLVQQGVTQQDYSVTGAMLAVATFALLTIALSRVNVRFPGARRVTHGVPVVVVHHGRPAHDVMSAERLSLDDLYGAARQQGIERLESVRLAGRETHGQISFFPFDRAAGEAGAGGRPAPG